MADGVAKEEDMARSLAQPTDRVGSSLESLAIQVRSGDGMQF